MAARGCAIAVELGVLLKTLAREWRDTATFSVVIDPEVFLTNTEYMMTIVNGAAAVTGLGRRRAVLVLEDAGELLAVDARREVGQGLSRLLNLTDGMLGVEHAPMVIVTSNEPIARLHPAVLRPGRCRSIIEFGPLSETRGRAWVELQGGDPDAVTGTATIAELATLVAGTDIVRRRRPRSRRRLRIVHPAL